MPKLDLRQVLVYNIFQDLTGSRNYSMSGAPLPIPYPVFSCYCADFNIRGAETIGQRWRQIQMLDGVYLEHMAEKSKKTK